MLFRSIRELPDSVVVTASLPCLPTRERESEAAAAHVRECAPWPLAGAALRTTLASIVALSSGVNCRDACVMRVCFSVMYITLVCVMRLFQLDNSLIKFVLDWIKFVCESVAIFEKSDFFIFQF